MSTWVGFGAMVRTFKKSTEAKCRDVYGPIGDEFVTIGIRDAGAVKAYRALSAATNCPLDSKNWGHGQLSDVQLSVQSPHVINEAYGAALNASNAAHLPAEVGRWDGCLVCHHGGYRGSKSCRHR